MISRCVVSLAGYGTFEYLVVKEDMVIEILVSVASDQLEWQLTELPEVVPGHLDPALARGGA